MQWTITDRQNQQKTAKHEAENDSNKTKIWISLLIDIIQYRSKISEPPNALSTRGHEEVNALVLFR